MGPIDGPLSDDEFGLVIMSVCLYLLTPTTPQKHVQYFIDQMKVIAPQLAARDETMRAVLEEAGGYEAFRERIRGMALSLSGGDPQKTPERLARVLRMVPSEPKEPA